MRTGKWESVIGPAAPGWRRGPYVPLTACRTGTGCSPSAWSPYTDVGVLDPVPGKPGQRPVRQFITLLTCTPVTLAFTPWRIAVTGVLTGMTPAAA